MEEQSQPQRKLSRSSKSTSARSLWNRKSTKKTTAGTAAGPALKHLDLQSSQSLVSMDSKLANDTSDEDHDFSTFISRSIIPDPLGELPAWFKKENSMAAANTSSYRIKYPLHNPTGPKWYKNYHLIPPAQLNPGNRPPSVFSPSFPPMASTLNDRSEDSIRLPGPSRTPSGTSLQTPSSSQIRIPESGGKPRSRKTSQDNADLLDASDPWGTHWHHQSPYDTGTTISPVSVDPPEGRSRSRLSSMNAAPTRRKTVTPSPLSQSTSALHTQPSEPNITRKLSKRRKPVLGNLFNGQDSLQVPDTSARRHSTIFPASVPNASTVALSTHSSKKERRTSVLGRLVRKFSMLTKSTQDVGPTISERAEDEVAAPSEPRRSFFSQRQSSPEKPSMEKKHSDPSKRVPPPQINIDLQTTDVLSRSIELEREIHDHRSSISLEVPFSPGRLTIANPDSPSTGGNTPIRQSLTEDSLHIDTSPLLQPVQHRHDRNPSRESVAHPSGKTSPVKRKSPAPAPSASIPDAVRSPASVQSLPPLSIHRHPPTIPSLSMGAPSLLTSFVAAPEVKTLHAYSIATAAIVSTSDDSPLSRASVLVNPPTPHNPEELHPDLPFELPEIERIPSKAPSRETSPVKKGDGEVRMTKSNSTTSRKTETFRLVRNPSDKVSPSGNTITAEGEQWTVVNSSDAPRRRRTKEKPVEKSERMERVEKPSSRYSTNYHENERVEKPSSRSSTRDRENSRKDQRRQDKAAHEVVENQGRAGSSSQGRTKRTKPETADSGALSERPSRARSFDTTSRTSVNQPMVFTLQGEPSRQRKSDDRPRDSYNPKPIRPGPSPISGNAHVQRVFSNTTRPTSELPSADINALRAREAWEMDRLWKGRSMNHQESNMIASPSSRDSPQVNGELVVDASGHGSSHTSYLVQPLQAHPMPASVFYANMPSAPPPIIYTASSPYGQMLHQASHQSVYRSPPNSFMFPSTEFPADPPSRQNPLPRPPRESSYQPAYLSTLADRGSGTSLDYWTNK
ncbi:uncharacterized protein EDB93DRAFT_4185 [Suillus bovinus]|uniref:uncharacterized protein n=1 Tax=Suillus bovinus TaxID=48563 RepID=UPI001B88275B|nr:uncharacterized protein EDB93DRAFT_4185 [Suillus bovinus]KAG2159643.1 hypothetical protein EDB93DRAFT_4185 [Suillus bovinus]